MKKGIEIFSLVGKNILITGGAGYLGSSISLMLAEAGAHVLVNSRSKDRASVVVGEILDKGLSAEVSSFDVANKSEIDAFFSAWGDSPLHGLINNAYFGGGGNIQVSEAQAYIDSYDVTVVAASNLFKAALPSLRSALKKDGDASVINIGSMYGSISPDLRIYEAASEINPPYYGAAKAALLQWTRYAACEFGPEGIRVNSVSLGPFPNIEVQVKNPSFINKLVLKVPMGRVGQSKEAGGAVIFLMSSASSYVNGSNLVVDGGWTSW